MNHGIVTTKQSVTGKKLREVLQDIASRRFKGTLQIRPWGSEDSSFFTLVHESDSPSLQIFLASKRRIELRKGSMGDFSSWLQAVIQDEIGAAFNGRCGDEGISEKWQPEPNKYPTFRSYMDMLYSEFGMEADRIKVLFDQTVSRIPQDMRQFVEAGT